MPFLAPKELQRRLQRADDWLNNRLTDGPLCMLTVQPSPEQREKLQQAFPVPEADDAAGLERWWTDPAFVTSRMEAEFLAATYLGDSWPYHYINLGPGALASFMGCRSILQPRTIWQEPLIKDWSTAPQLELVEDSPLWLATQELTKASIAASGGRWLTSITDIGGAMDITSYFRTPEKLCFDLLEAPEQVLASEEAVLKAWFQVYDRLAAEVIAQSGGTSSWGLTWGRGRHYMLQCDFSCLIGPEMFRQFVLPYLTRQAAGLDACCYHLDGPDAIRHADDVCAVPGINCIQWIPGAGNSWAVADWIDLYRRIQDNGCGIYMWCREDELELVFNELDVNRLMLIIGPQGKEPFTVAQGEAVLSKIDRLRKGRRQMI